MNRAGTTEVRQLNHIITSGVLALEQREALSDSSQAITLSPSAPGCHMALHISLISGMLTAIINVSTEG